MATIAKRILNVFEAEKFSDVTFLLKSGDHCVEVKGHKMIFAAMSSVFERMLFGEFPDSNEITIENVDVDAFKSFRKYLYTDKITFESVFHAICVYEIADKYDVEDLLQNSIKYLSSNISAENALRIIEFSRVYQKPDFEKRCLDIIRCDTIQVLNSDDFLHCDLHFINMIVNEERLNISEIDLFKAIENWAAVNMDIDGDAGKDKFLFAEIINKIRFFSMTLNEFIQGPNKSSLLTLEERHSLLSNIAVRGSIVVPSRFCKEDYSRRTSKPVCVKECAEDPGNVDVYLEADASVFDSTLENSMYNHMNSFPICTAQLKRVYLQHMLNLNSSVRIINPVPNWLERNYEFLVGGQRRS